ncbi:M48 family metalloprotease [Chlorogloeopsis sp. ULAP01]|uniref:M48 family metallopeptidase n=1 Tax=Chlorogloeopsis sp. ULAP01 TaxID=3056483 RepID=UPI0025AB034A|nr:M48 family metalloprotease [Chlorogloeopsis sp. ULAP01]MDM9383130.1 M48 family metalloprotease [Chlorogloeopsis sp. ULAP01]
MMNRKNLYFNYNFFWRRYFYPLVSVLVALSICLSTALPSQALDWLPLLLRGVQVLQLSNISDRQEADIGKQINQELLSGDVRLYRDPEINRYVEQIGQRLAENSDRPNLKFTFQVVDSDSINAFATLGGYVYIHTGLLKAAANEAELASVVAHEIGHIGGKHLIKQMRQKAIDEGLLTAAGLDRSTAVQLGVQLARNLPRSRQMEFDADQRGLKTFSRTGYAQSGMISFMQKLLSSSSQRSVPTFLSTHPATSDRIEALKRAMNNQPSNSNQGLDNTAYQASIRALLKS